MLAELIKIPNIDIIQIKEKWCSLVVSYNTGAFNENNKKIIRDIVSRCVNRLQAKQVYPITMEDYVAAFKSQKGESNGEQNK